MNFNSLATFIVIYMTLVEGKLKFKKDQLRSNVLIDHTAVTDGNVFPYVVAVLKKFSYLSAGALLDNQWVLTAADSLYTVRESSRVIRVRLGSTNYKKGGILLPVKTIEIHPYFDDSKPAFDIALVKLAQRVRFSPNIYPIKMQNRMKEVTATHFIVTAWRTSLHLSSSSQKKNLLPTLKQRRIMSLSHLHPTKPAECIDELAALEINDTRALMCLDPDFKSDPCWRDTGAPVVLNGILWGIVSSWRPDDCQVEPGTNFVTLVATRNISSWIHATTSGNKWNMTLSVTEELSEEDESTEI